MQPDDQTIHKHGVQSLRQIFWKQDLDSAELIATVSDALRSPLTAIKGYAETLLRHGQQLSEQERREFLHIIKEASDELATVITDLLDEAPVHKQPAAVGLLHNLRHEVVADHQQPVQAHQQAVEEFTSV
jgi:K+-sensing histidine kinase KdpD